MIHAHDLQNLLIRGPRTKPVAEFAEELLPVPVLVEIRLPGANRPQVPVIAMRVENGQYVLTIEPDAQICSTVAELRAYAKGYYAGKEAAKK